MTGFPAWGRDIHKYDLLERVFTMPQNQTGNRQYLSFNRASVQEYFTHAQCFSDKEADVAVAELFGFLREKAARPVNVRVFVKNGLFNAVNAIFQPHLESLKCPITWLSQPDKPAVPAVSFQVHAIAGTPIEPVLDGDRQVGCRVRDDHAEYIYLQVLSSPEDNDKYEVTRGIFNKMGLTLQTADFDFSRTLRTWLFADDILAWYDKLNRGRDHFFQQYDIFNQLVPASTGVGIANPFGLALSTELLAVRPLNGDVRIEKVVSPLQCEALDYKSSFSRAVHMQTPDHSRMYVSGTASIAPDGTTAYVGDCAKQIDLTMQVVEALIKNGSMDWSNSVRAITYFKNSEDFGLFDAFCEKAGLNLPHVKIEADVCRHDLLFELELELLSLSNPDN